MRRAFGILTDTHPLVGRIPRLVRPVPLLVPEGAHWGVGWDDFADRLVKDAESSLLSPFAWLRLPADVRARLARRGFRPSLAGGRQSDAYRVLGALFALSTSVKTHLYVLSSVTAGQQAPTFDYLESSCDGASGNWTHTLEGSTHATAGTAGTAPTVTQVGRYPPLTSGTATGGIIGGNYTAEPTALQAFSALIMPMPTAPLIVQNPLGRDVEGNPTAAAVMRAVAVRALVSTGTPNQRSMLEFEE